MRLACRLTHAPPLADGDNPVSDPDIDACNVLPAFEASIAAGLSEAETEREVGWQRAELERDGTVVSGRSTYVHMELMASRPNYAAFVLDAVSRHDASSLGVVGLACKTSRTLGEAIARHGRFQHLTNRTATYAGRVDDGVFVLAETRLGDARPGSALISEYTMLVAAALIRTLLGRAVAFSEIRTRRSEIEPAARAAFEAFAGAPIQCGAAQAAIVFDAGVLVEPIPTADPELAAYFLATLEKASPAAADEDPLLQRVRAGIQEQLVTGGASLSALASTLGVGERTLQRRLGERGVVFNEVVTATRKALAAEYLSNPELSLAEVAYLLGYSEQASFFRAFRRWFNTTPAAYRRG